MENLATVEIKAFVPAKDFELSKRFYSDLGFQLELLSDQLAYFCHGRSSFLLQNFYNEIYASNFMMHLMVEDVDAWWRLIQKKDIASRYAVRAEPPEDRPWGLRDFILVDPSSVLWRIAQTIETAG